MKILKEMVFKKTRIRIINGDLTESTADAIVNAANSYLQHGGGVAGAISKKGGPVIQEESNRIGYVPVGNSVITKAGNLKAGHIIHTVGPRWGEGDEENKLKRSIKNTLRLAAENGFKTISIPAISAGIFGFPKERCAIIMVEEIVDFIKGNETSLERVDIYLIDNEIIKFFEILIEQFNRNNKEDE